MTPKQYRAVRKELGLSNEEVAKTIGVSRRVPFRYQKGDVDVPEPAARLLRLLVMLRMSLGSRKFNEIVERLQ